MADNVVDQKDIAAIFKRLRALPENKVKTELFENISFCPQVVNLFVFAAFRLALIADTVIQHGHQ